MSRWVHKFIVLILVFATSELFSPKLFAQMPRSSPPSSAPSGQPMQLSPELLPTVDLDVYVKGANGAAVQAAAVVTLTKLDGQVFVQGTANGGYVRFNRLPPTEFALQVVAPAYERVVQRIDTRVQDPLLKVTVELRPVSDPEEAASELGLAALAPTSATWTDSQPPNP